MAKKKLFVKILATLTALSLIFCTLFSLTACAEYDWQEQDNFEIGYCKKINDAFLGEYFWHGHIGEDMDIVLPDTYNSAPVTALGGYCGLGVPTPFQIHFIGTDDLEKELFGDVDGTWLYINCKINSNTQEEVIADVKAQLERYYDISKGFEIKDVVFNLYIGSNLQKIELISSENVSDRIKTLTFIVNDENEVLSVCAYSFVITVNEQNEYFYSDELGRMYYKENNNLVECFLYHNRDEFPASSLPLN
mgnify:CR=1 FL=1